MKKCLTLVAAVMILMLPGLSCGAEPEDIHEKFDAGVINWTQGVFVSKGVSTPPTKNQDIALNDARDRALKNMLTVMLQTPVMGSITVGDAAGRNELAMAQLESLAKGAKVAKQEYLSDGTVEITLQLNLFGGFSQLILPAEIKQIEPIKTVSGTSQGNDGKDGGMPAGSQTAVYTGLVVDARGTKFRPALAPVILDEGGKEIYGGAFVSREFAVQRGMGKYLCDVKAAQKDPRVGRNPLTVKGLRADPQVLSNIVISHGDASKIRSASEHISFLKQCRVIIVMDPFEEAQ